MMANKEGEHSGFNVNYYCVDIKRPKRPEWQPYQAEAEDIIEALGMTFAEGTVFKSLWRSCAARTLGKLKLGGDDVRDAEKMCYYSQRTLAQRIAARDTTVTYFDAGGKPLPAHDQSR
jgi:hypothetical protein